MTSSSGIRLFALALATFAWCGYESGFHPSTEEGFLAWLATLVAVGLGIGILSRGNRHERPLASSGLAVSPEADSDARTGRSKPLIWWIGPWLALGCTIAAWEALGLDTGRDEPHLTLSALGLAYRSVRAATLLAWIAAGLGYGHARARLHSGDEPPARPKRARTAPRIALAGWPHGGADGRVIALLLGPSRAVGIAFWLAVAAAVLLVELVAARSRGAIARLGDLVRLVPGGWPGQLIAALLWAYAGWHLFAHWP